MAMAVEALRAYHEGVAGNPGLEAAGQLDLGAVMGIGFPAFRGGVLRYIDDYGHAEFGAKVKELEKQFGARFALPQQFLDQHGKKYTY